MLKLKDENNKEKVKIEILRNFGIYRIKHNIRKNKNSS